MPTGYTDKLMREGQSFEEFVLSCARAFGACIEMKDAPANEPIPESFSVDNYHLKEAKKAKAYLAQLNALSDEEKKKLGNKERIKQLNRAKKSLKKALAENKRLDLMLAQVHNWTPPTPDHRGLKDFMIDQIGISRENTDYYKDSLEKAASKTAEAYFQTMLDSAVWSIEYHEREYARELERSKERNEWLKALRMSIPTRSQK